MQDARGVDVSSDSEAAIAALDHFSEQMLSLGPTPMRVLSDADENPGCGLLQAQAAVFHLYGMTEADNAAAATFLARARATGRPGPREDLWYAGVDAWLRGDYEAAMDGFEEITGRWPRDLLAAKVAEFHYYATGQHWQARRFLAHMERIAPVNQDSSHFLSMHAFALELSGRFDEARALAERAIDMVRASPWAHHCLAHVFIRRGEIEHGEAVMRDLEPTWDESGQPIHGHNAWHLALFSLARLDFEETLRIHRKSVSGALPGSVGEQVDAISLLWRIEMAGRELDDEWASLADYLEPRAEECFIPFVTAHNVYALARAGRTEAVECQIAASRRARDATSGERRRVWDDAGLALVDACAAFAQGDSVRSATLLEPVVEGIGCVGGSDAQDDLFRQTFLSSLIRAGRRESANAVLARILDGRPPSPLESTWGAQS
ncbi:MAG: hypothetical protein P8R42_09020 [Candidatus Binatia bacterium]|nr:hypothetical protein [Candidatus Binatia bacterium]